MDQSKPSSSSSMSNDLITDTVVEILSWLPVDSLLQFKSVSKSWFSLITNPNFAKLHFHHHHSLTATAQIHNPTVMFVSKTHYSLKSMDKVVLSSTTVVHEKMEMVYPFDFPKHSIRIEGSCHGLICISMIPTYDHVDRNNILCLWNPSTKEFKQLPSHVDDTPFKFPPYHGEGRRRVFKVERYGFGYDHIMKDYKVIASVQLFCLVEFADDEDDMYFYELKVYTLGTNSWRKIQGIPYESEWHRNTKSTWTQVNGAFHRIAKLSSSDIRILCFDIVEEVYREVPKPKCFDGRYEWELAVLKGCLCLCAHKWLSTKQGYMMEVWMMMNYGVKESWTKLFNITNVVDSYQLKPVWFCRNGEVLMVGDSKLVIYDPKCNEAKLLKCRSNARVDLPFETEIYIGSLVSLKSQERNCERTDHLLA